jgi:hypothetical protein
MVLQRALRRDIDVDFDEPVRTARGYFLVCPLARPEAPAVPAFRRWLFAACA